MSGCLGLIGSKHGMGSGCKTIAGLHLTLHRVREIILEREVFRVQFFVQPLQCLLVKLVHLVISRVYLLEVYHAYRFLKVT